MTPSQDHESVGSCNGPDKNNRDGKEPRVQTKTIHAIGLLLALAMPAMAAQTTTRVMAYDYEPTGGLRTKEIVDPDVPSLCLVQETAYTAQGNVERRVTRNCAGSAGSVPGTNSEAAAPDATRQFPARRHLFGYADPRFPSLVTDPADHADEMAYHAGTGARTLLRGPNGDTVRWTHDALGRPTLERGPDGNGRRWTYEYCSTVLAGGVSCPQVGGIAAVYVITEIPVAGVDIDARTHGAQNGVSTKGYYDGLDRPLRIEVDGFDGAGPRKIYSNIEYDASGRKSRESRPYYAGNSPRWSAYQHDALGRVTRETRADGGYTTWTYSGPATIESTHVLASPTTYSAISQQSVQTRDARGQVIAVTAEHGAGLARKYGPFGLLNSVSDALGNTVLYQYDDRGRLVRLLDPDIGVVGYDRNPLGEIVARTDAKRQRTTYAYNILGELTTRNEPDLVTTWSFDRYRNGAACAFGKRRLCEQSTDNGASSRYTFDSVGRVIHNGWTIGSAYGSSVEYDANGRPSKLTYPSGFALRYAYSPLGFLSTIGNASTGESYRRTLDVDAEQRVTGHVVGNSIETRRVYDPASGLPSSIQAGPGGSVLALAYSHDLGGNPRVRVDSGTGVTAAYDYDNLNRLKEERVSGGALTAPVSTAWNYDASGNIVSRSDIGTYQYPAAGAASKRPHTVSAITGTVNGVTNPSFSYDANGNLGSGLGRSYVWTSFDKPLSVTRSNATLAWTYGPRHERVREVHSVSGSTRRTTIYVASPFGSGPYFEEEVSNGSVVHKHYLVAGGELLGVARTVPPATGATLRYFHTDAQGSLHAVTDGTGAVLERFGYEAFGKRRHANGSADGSGTLTGATTDRGYTGHEMLDEIGLIHTNGRLYDGAIGRFTSADPFVQDEAGTQAYNRYSYVFNNPMRYVDPSGYIAASTTAPTSLSTVTITGTRGAGGPPDGTGSTGSTASMPALPITVNGQNAGALSNDAGNAAIRNAAFDDAISPAEPDSEDEGVTLLAAGKGKALLDLIFKPKRAPKPPPPPPPAPPPPPLVTKPTAPPAPTAPAAAPAQPQQLQQVEVKGTRATKDGHLNIGTSISPADREVMKKLWKGEAKLGDMTPEAREAAAKVFDQTAAKEGQHALGIAFNRARAAFLRGEGPNPGVNAVDFGKANGIPMPGKGGGGL